MKKKIIGGLLALTLLTGCGTTRQSIDHTYINDNGELVVVYNDGTEDNLGVVKGQDGRDGKDGQDGKDGKDGVDGKDGLNGQDGRDGKDGIDGKDGKDGKDGVNGQDGRDGQDGQDGSLVYVCEYCHKELSYCECSFDPVFQDTATNYYSYYIKENTFIPVLAVYCYYKNYTVSCCSDGLPMVYSDRIATNAVTKDDYINYSCIYRKPGINYADYVRDCTSRISPSTTATGGGLRGYETVVYLTNVRIEKIHLCPTWYGSTQVRQVILSYEDSYTPFEFSVRNTKQYVAATHSYSDSSIPVGSVCEIIAPHSYDCGRGFFGDYTLHWYDNLGANIKRATYWVRCRIDSIEYDKNNKPHYNITVLEYHEAFSDYKGYYYYK